LLIKYELKNRYSNNTDFTFKYEKDNKFNNEPEKEDLLFLSYFSEIQLYESEINIK